MSQSVRSEVDRIDATFSQNANAGNADALVREFYADDAVLLPPGAPAIKGVTAIRNFWKGLIEAGATNVKLQTQSVDASGDLAYEIGQYSFMIPNQQGESTQQTGKYLVVFKRQSNGALKAVADMFSGNQ